MRNYKKIIIISIVVLIIVLFVVIADIFVCEKKIIKTTRDIVERVEYTFLLQTFPFGWKSTELVEGCNCKLPPDYSLQVTNKNKDFSEREVIIKNKSKIKYLGFFMTQEKYAEAGDKMIKKVFGKKVGFDDAEENIVETGMIYSNGGSLEHCKVMYEDKSFNSYVIVVENSFGEKEEDLALILVDVLPDKESHYVGKNIVCNIFAE